MIDNRKKKKRDSNFFISPKSYFKFDIGYMRRGRAPHNY